MALSKNLDMLNFAHNAYIVDESKYPCKVKDAGASKSPGKRKATDVVDLDSDEVVKVKGDDEVALPIRDSQTHEEEGSVGHDIDCMEAREPSIVELNNDVHVAGDYKTLQRERAERSATSLRFFSEPSEFEWPSNVLVVVSPPVSRGRVDSVRLDCRKSRVSEDQSCGGALPIKGHSQETSSGIPRQSSAPHFSFASEDTANSHMTSMMKLLERQQEHSCNMQRKMQWKNREFQREVGEES